MWPGNPFTHAAWLAAHTDVLEPGLVIETWSTSTGETQTVHAPGGPLRLLGDRLSDRLEVDLAALGSALDAARARGQGVRFGPMCVHDAEALAETHPLARLDEHVTCPVVRFGGRTWASYLGGPEARRRRRIARQADDLLADGGVVVAEATEPSAVLAALAVLATLHRARFGERSESFTPVKEAALAAALGPMAVDGLVTIRTVEVAGRPAAAVLTFLGAGREWFYQSGWDPELADRSVGRAAFVSLVRAACDEGRDLCLLRGDEEYKQWWATADEPVATVVVDRW